jgi:hypothetical protein
MTSPHHTHAVQRRLHVYVECNPRFVKEYVLFVTDDRDELSSESAATHLNIVVRRSMLYALVILGVVWRRRMTFIAVVLLTLVLGALPPMRAASADLLLVYSETDRYAASHTILLARYSFTPLIVIAYPWEISWIRDMIYLFVFHVLSRGGTVADFDLDG